MSDLSANLQRDYFVGDVMGSLPVKASTEIFLGAAIGITSGYARQLVAGDAFGGFADAHINNTVATNGAADIPVVRKGRIQLSITSAAATDINKAVYASDSNTFTFTGTSNTRVGQVTRFISTGVVEVEFRTSAIASLTGVTALTDNSTGSASNTIAAGAGVQTLSFPVQLASLTTAAADLATAYVPGYKFKLLAMSIVTTTLGTGTSASQVFNLKIGSTAVTGGVLTLLLANTDTLGKKIDATAITAANTGAATDTLSVQVAASGTVFTAGAAVLLIKIQNMDTADAIASIALKDNQIISALP